MLSTNEWSTESSSLVAKSRCYWKIMTARWVEPQTLCWEHSRSGELHPHLKQDLRVLLVGGHGVCPLGPPPAAAQRHSCRFSMLWLKMDLTGMSVAALVCLLYEPFSRSVLGNVGVSQPMLSSPLAGGAVVGESWNTSLQIFPSHNVLSEVERISVFLFASPTPNRWWNNLCYLGIVLSLVQDAWMLELEAA